MYMNNEKKDVAPIKQVKDTIKKQKDNYSIYYYLKKNTSVLIAIVSALIAIIAGFLKYSDYLYHRASLKYWNIDPQIVCVSEINWFEYIVISFAFLVCLCIIIGIINDIVIAFYKCRYFIKTEKKKIKKIKKEINQKNIIRESKKANLKSAQYQEIKKKNKEFLVYAWSNFVTYEFFICLILFMLIMLTIFRSSCSLIEFFSALFTAILTAVICTSLLYVIACIDTNVDIKNDINNLILFPIEKIRQLGVKHYFSNKHIFRYLIFMFLVVIFFLIIIPIMGASEQEDKNMFSIATINSKTYAIMAIDSGNIIAERIEIDDKNAVIHINEQIIIPKENIEMNIYNFENVLKTDK